MQRNVKRRFGLINSLTRSPKAKCGHRCGLAPVSVAVTFAVPICMPCIFMITSLLALIYHRIVFKIFTTTPPPLSLSLSLSPASLSLSLLPPSLSLSLSPLLSVCLSLSVSLPLSLFLSLALSLFMPGCD